MYYRSGGIIILVSLVMAVIGFWRLWRAGRKKAFFMFIAGVVAYPIMFSLVMKVSDDHLRLWVAVPVAGLGPLWLLIGLFVYGSPENEPSKQLIDGKNISSESQKSTTRTRILGLILTLIGIILWVYGATHPYMISMTKLIVLGGFMYSTLIGLCWLITGKKMGEM